MAVPARSFDEDWSSYDALAAAAANDYSKLEDRLQSFKHWPLYHPVKPAALAESGFFMLMSNAVKCFSCDLELHEWEFGDVAADEHFQWSPDCPHNAKLMKRLSKLKNAGKTEEELKEIEQLKTCIDPMIARVNKMTILELQNKYLELHNRYRCKVCLDNPITMLFDPCHHAVVCTECYDQMERMSFLPKCPTCRKVIKRCSEVFM